MSGQVDVGWSVAPFNLEPLPRATCAWSRARATCAIRGQTIRVQIANLNVLEQKRDAIARYRAAYKETLDWMYTSPDAVARYVEFSKLPESAVKRMLAEFIPKESLQIDTVAGAAESMQDAIQFKFLAAP